MEQETYNGWKNYETWNVNLWIENEERFYRLRECNINNVEPKSWTAESVEGFVRGILPEGTPDFDSLGADGRFCEPGDGVRAKGYDEVDWQEIANAWNE